MILINAFNVTFYRTSSSPKAIEKDISIVKAPNVPIRATHSLDMLSPVLELDYNANILGSNYCYIMKFSRYYWINDIVTQPGKKITVSLRVDPLMSWAAQIKEAKAMIIRLEDKGAPTLYPDNKLPVIPGVEKVESTIATNNRIKTVIPGLPDNGYIITVVNGGVISS